MVGFLRINAHVTFMRVDLAKGPHTWRSIGDVSAFPLLDFTRIWVSLFRDRCMLTSNRFLPSLFYAFFLRNRPKVSSHIHAAS